MKKTIPKEVLFCDKCEIEVSFLISCMECGVEMCHDCREEHGKGYRHSAYYSGAGDGFYCKPCDAKLTKAGNDKRHNAYRYIASLKLEREAWEADFKRRQDEAEALVKSLSR